MSTEKKTLVEEIVNFPAVQRILTKLGLTDEGKLNKFYRQEVKIAKEAIEGIELNIQAKELYRKQAVSKIDRDIEDAQNEVDDAYDNVLPEDIDTNAKMAAHSKKYWDGVRAAEDKLSSLTKAAEKATEEYEEGIKDLKEQIAKYQARIARICK